MWKWFTRIVIGVALLVLALKALDWVARRAESLPALPQPNGYDALLAIAATISKPSGDLVELSSEQIREMSRQNQPAWEKLGPALEMESRVPLSTAPKWVDQHGEDVKNLKKLAVALALHAKALMLDGRTNEAARCHLNTIRLGQTLARGGVLVDGITSIAVESIGTASLRAMSPALSAQECRAMAKTLAVAEVNRDSPENILLNQRRWSAASFGLVSKVGGILLRNASAKRHSEFTTRYHESTKRTRRLILLLAARTFELETGQRPSRPSDLVPDFLPTVPTDPDTGSPMSALPPASNE